MNEIKRLIHEAVSETFREFGIEYSKMIGEKNEKDELLEEIEKIAKQGDFTDKELKNLLVMIMTYRRKHKNKKLTTDN